MQSIKNTLRHYRFEIISLVVLVLLLWMIAISSRGKHITQQFFDVVRTTSERNEVVILGIDDTSLQALGAWPWNRSIFAEVTKKLDDYRAKAVVFDVLFLEGRDGDDAFREVLKNVKIPVVLASKIEDGKYLESFLVRQSSSTVVASALSNVNPDSDGKV